METFLYHYSYNVPILCGENLILQRKEVVSVCAVSSLYSGRTKLEPFRTVFVLDFRVIWKYWFSLQSIFRSFNFKIFILALIEWVVLQV